MTSTTSTDNGETAALLVAFACGVVAGAACGLLLAPASGRDARGWVASQGRAGRARAVRLMERNRYLVDVMRSEGVRGLLQRLPPRAAEKSAATLPSQEPLVP